MYKKNAYFKTRELNDIFIIVIQKGKKYKSMSVEYSSVLS